MTARWSYGGLMRLPVFALRDAERQLVATVRCASAEEARELFRAGLSEAEKARGRRVSRL